MAISEESVVLGRRIFVCGVTGSGKTAIARALSRSLGLPCIELDAIAWQPGWQMLRYEEFIPRALAAIEAAPAGWVCEGSYSRLRQAILPLTDTVIWLRLPWRVSFWRLLKRTARRLWTREELWNTNRESLRTQLFSRNSLILWAISHHRASQRSVRRSLDEVSHAPRVYELRSVREVEAFIQAAERMAEGAS